MMTQLRSRDALKCHRLQIVHLILVFAVAVLAISGTTRGGQTIYVNNTVELKTNLSVSVCVRCARAQVVPFHCATVFNNEQLLCQIR